MGNLQTWVKAEGGVWRRGILFLVLLALSLPAVAGSQAASPQVRYGANAAAGHTFVHDGVRLYYEVYGAGEPLLLIHGNGGNIGDLAAQIAHFRKHYRVIAMDSRDHGQSGDSSDKLTYEKMADDLAALMDHLKTGPVHVVGWSDGGVEALLLGIRHPAKVKKLVAMAANLNPSEEAFPPEILALFHSIMDTMPAGKKKRRLRDGVN